MKNLKQYIFESEQSINIKSDIIEMKVPKDKVSELGKLLPQKELDFSEEDDNIEIDVEDLTPFICDCKILNRNSVKTFKHNDWSYIIKKGSPYIPSDEKSKYVSISNCEAYTKQKKIKHEDGDISCMKSDDKVLNFYWIDHSSEGQSLNVVADPEQVALAIIIDLSARMAKDDVNKRLTPELSAQSKKIAKQVSDDLKKLSWEGREVVAKDIFNEIAQYLDKRYVNSYF